MKIMRYDMRGSYRFILLLIFTSLCGTFQVRSFSGKFLVGSAGVSLASYLLYKNNESFKSYVDQTAAQLKELFINRVGVPLYAAYDRIKDEGLSKSDYALLGVFALGCYALKRVGSRYSVWSGIRDQDFKKAGIQVWSDGEWVADNKKLVGSLLVGAGVLTWIIKDGRSLSYLERFWYSLTHRQKEVLSEHPELSGIEVHESTDPSILKDHEAFHSTLHDHQKELLDEAVEEYRMNYDPLSLFDDFEDD